MGSVILLILFFSLKFSIDSVSLKHFLQEMMCRHALRLSVIFYSLSGSKVCPDCITGYCLPVFPLKMECGMWPSVFLAVL